MNFPNNTFNPTFHGVKDIKLIQEFKPEIFTEQSRVLNAFKENPTLKKFFKKHDGIVIFDNYFAHDREYTSMTVKYNKKFSPRNILLSMIFGKKNEKVYSNDFSLMTTDAYCSCCATKLADKIKNITNMQTIIGK